MSAAAAVAAAALPLGAAAQQPAAPAPAARAEVRDLGPGLAGRILRHALARPHDVVIAPDTGLTFGRDTAFARTVLVIGGPVRVASTVRGDLLVVGDLFLRPGASIDGRAVAFGGGAYNSTLARVGGGVEAFRDVTFDAGRDPTTGGIVLAYRDLERHRLRVVSLPGRFGVRLPGYGRIDGLALTFGPEVALAEGRVRLEPVVTYRSHLGVVDPGVRALVALGRRTEIEGRAERGTFTNDAWMRGDLVNGFVTFVSGGDVRNYWRADRIELVARRRVEWLGGQIEPFVGARHERSWSAARDSGATSAPFSVFGRDDVREGMRRPNPGVTGGTIASLLAGAAASTEGEIESRLALAAEVPVTAPGAARFVQLTADAGIGFAGFADHRVHVLAHAVATVGDAAPSQRHAYLGGGPTLPSIPLLALGGDRLVWTETRYTIPVERVRLPFVGAPSVTLRHMIGSAGVGRLPAFTQNLGLRINVGPLRADYTFDPTGAGEREFQIGVGFR